MKCPKCDFETDKPHRDAQECINVIRGASGRVTDTLMFMNKAVQKEYDKVIPNKLALNSAYGKFGQPE